MTDSEMLQTANEIAGKRGLTADFLGDARSVGVGGDNRSYTRIIVLQGPHPGNEALATISTEISNRTGINRITLDITPRKAM